MTCVIKPPANQPIFYASLGFLIEFLITVIRPTKVNITTVNNPTTKKPTAIVPENCINAPVSIVASWLVVVTIGLIKFVMFVSPPFNSE